MCLNNVFIGSLGKLYKTEHGRGVGGNDIGQRQCCVNNVSVVKLLMSYDVTECVVYMFRAMTL